MKIGFISDTHGGYMDTQKALAALGPCDAIIHLGDVLNHGPRNDIPESYNPKALAELLKGMDNLYFVRGNCDSDVDQMVTQQDLTQKHRLIDLGEVKIYAIHGYEETMEERIAEAKKLGATLVAFGHTHIKVLEHQDGIWILNPGSTTIPKDGSASCALWDNGILKHIIL